MPLPANIIILITLLSLLLFAVVPQNSLADNLPLQETNDIPVLPKVTVTGQYVDTLTTSTTIDREQINRLPHKDETITDLLKIVPGVQFAEEGDASFQAGEIKPAEVSISGGRTYDNNFIIDGLSHSSSLDPAASKIDDINILPGHPQDTFISSSLLQSVTILDHNISARYGNFTGGVIEADTINPGDELTGLISYRTTRDNWINFFIHPDDQAAFNESGSTTKQPHFDKHYLNFQMSGPLNDFNGLLFAYSLGYTEIPLKPFATEEEQTRRSENYLVKQVYTPSNNSLLRTSLTITPYREKAFLLNTKNSSFTNEVDTYVLQTDFEKSTQTSQRELKLALTSTVSQRTAPDNFYSWSSSLGPTKDWGQLLGNTKSNEGGFGDLRRSQRGMNLQGHWSNTPFKSESVNLQINSGFEYEFTRAKYTRPATVLSYKKAKALSSGEFCLPGDDACVSEEQYLSERLVYQAGSSSEQVNQLATYIEMSQIIQCLNLRPGLRFSYDDLMENFNIAPRAVFSYDLFADGSTVFTAGANRYYGQNLLAAKLRQAIQPLAKATRTSHLDPWTVAEQLKFVTATQFTRLKTPYSDELSLGVQQKILSSTLTLDYVQRNNKDQLAKETDPIDFSDPFAVRNITLNNNGTSKYRSYRLAWEKFWEKHSLIINATYEETFSSNESYTETLDEEDLEDIVYHDGELKFKTDLPREDFSRPWTINLIYMADLPFGFSFTNTTRYQSRYRVLGDTKENITIGEASFDVYDEISKQSALTFDWQIAWRKELLRQQYLELTLDIYNVFNRKIPIGTEDDEFRLGRQFWAGVSYNF